MNLTSRQQQILDLIIDYIETTGFPPTRANIAEKILRPNGSFKQRSYKLIK